MPQSAQSVEELAFSFGISIAESKLMKNKKRALKPPYITEEDFNEMIASRGVPRPSSDSKGDTAADELLETRLGEEYERDESIYGLRKKEIILADHPAHGDGESAGSEELVDESVGVRSSGRPDPIEDLDSPTSTH